MIGAPDHYREQRDDALRHAESGLGDREAWLRIAAEWQKIIDAVGLDAKQREKSRSEEH